jgi:hypothetical protein
VRRTHQTSKLHWGGSRYRHHFFFVVVVTMAVNRESSPSAAKNPVKAQVGLTASAVAITNLDEQSWPSVTV